jgi:hypothetical protein
MKRTCLHCKNHFRPSKFHHNQNYCNNKECQRARKALWQKNKIKEDSAYKDNQKDALHCWREKNPSYYRDYRKNHPEYTDRNRKKSRERSQKQGYRTKTSPALQQKQDFAKMDVALSQLPIKSGRYKLLPIETAGFAKMDAAIVQLIVIQDVTKSETFLQI